MRQCLITFKGLVKKTQETRVKTVVTTQAGEEGMRRVHSFSLQSVARIVRERDPGEYYVDPDAPGFLD